MSLIYRRDWKKRFKCEASCFDTLGEVKIPLSTPNHIQPILDELYVLPDYAPALLGLDLLDSNSLIVEKIMKRLTKMVVLDGFENGYKKLKESFTELVVCPI